MLAEAYVTLAGLPLHYREEGTGPPLVFLHALGRDVSDWDGVIGRLGTRYRCLALDQRGHGSSGHPGRYSFELPRDDLLGSVDQLDSSGSRSLATRSQAHCAEASPGVAGKFAGGT